mgnify:CR=1 FL=1
MMKKDIRKLSEKEFAAFVKSYYKALEPLGEFDGGYYEKNNMLLALNISSPLMKTFAATLGIPKVPMLLAEALVRKDLPPLSPPFTSPVFGGLMDHYWDALPKAHKDFVIGIWDHNNEDGHRYPKITVWDLEADGSLTPAAFQSLRKAGKKELDVMKARTETVLRKTYVYKIARSVSGIKLKKVRNYVVQGAQEEKLMALLQSKKKAFITQAVELCVALDKLDFLSHVIENVLHFNPLALSQLGKM